jgi:hypothetical protein
VLPFKYGDRQCNYSKKRSRYKPFEEVAVFPARYSGREKSKGQYYRKKMKISDSPSNIMLLPFLTTKDKLSEMISCIGFTSSCLMSSNASA